MKVPTPRKLKSGTWFCQLRLGGESVPVTAATEKDCRRQASLLKAEYLNGKRIANTSGVKTFRAGVDSLLAEKGSLLSPVTVRTYRTIQRNGFKAYADIDIRRVNWQKAIADESKHYAAKTVCSRWGLVTDVMHHLGLPVPNVLLPVVVEEPRNWLDYEQISVFVDAVAGTPYAAAALLALHSLRRSEICALDPSTQIDTKKKRIFVKGAAVPDEHHKLVRKKENKTKASRRPIPIMIPELEAALDALGDGPILPCSANNLNHHIKKICEKNSLPPVTLHGLRVSFCSLAYHVGVPEKECMEMGGWEDSKTMHKIYERIAKSDFSQHQNAMAEFYKNRKNANKNANAS